MKTLLFSVTKKDLRIDTFRSGGKGGQNQNKRDTGVRIVHEPSGAVGESREERNQLQNKRTAFKRMVKTEKFQKWIRIESAKKIGKVVELERRVEESLHSANLKIERKNSKGLWEICEEDDLS